MSFVIVIVVCILLIFNLLVACLADFPILKI